MVLFFGMSIFNYLFIERRYIFWVKWDYPVLWAFLCTFKFVFFKIYIMLILYLDIFQGGFEVSNAIFQASLYVTIVTTIVYYSICHC